MRALGENLSKVCYSCTEEKGKLSNFLLDYTKIVANSKTDLWLCQLAWTTLNQYQMLKNVFDFIWDVAASGFNCVQPQESLCCPSGCRVKARLKI